MINGAYHSAYRILSYLITVLIIPLSQCSFISYLSHCTSGVGSESHLKTSSRLLKPRAATTCRCASAEQQQQRGRARTCTAAGLYNFSSSDCSPFSSSVNGSGCPSRRRCVKAVACSPEQLLDLDTFLLMNTSKFAACKRRHLHSGLGENECSEVANTCFSARIVTYITINRIKLPQTQC